MYVNQARELRHPYYKLLKLDIEVLKIELLSWSRIELINWLCWNDRNGIYLDIDSMSEFGNIMSKEEAIAIVIKQIEEEK